MFKRKKEEPVVRPELVEPPPMKRYKVCYHYYGLNVTPTFRELHARAVEFGDNFVHFTNAYGRGFGWVSEPSTAVIARSHVVSVEFLGFVEESE